MSNLNLNTISSLDTGREVDVNRVMQAVDYVGGLVIDSLDTVIVVGNNRYVLTASTALPYTTTGAGMPEGGAFVAVGDAVLRQELSSSSGASLIHYHNLNVEGRLDKTPVLSQFLTLEEALKSGERVYIDGGEQSIDLSGDIQYILQNLYRVEAPSSITLNIPSGKYIYSSGNIVNVGSNQNIKLQGSELIKTKLEAVVSVSGTSRNWSVDIQLENAEGVEIGDYLKLDEVRPLFCKGGDYGYMISSVADPGEIFAPRSHLGYLRRLNAGDTVLTFTKTEDVSSHINVGDLITIKGETHVVGGVTSSNLTINTPMLHGSSGNYYDYFVTKPEQGFLQSVTSSKTITGIGTNFLSVANQGDSLLVDGALYRIDSVESDTQITISNAVTLPENTPFSIINSAILHEGAHEITAVSGNVVTVKNTSFKRPPLRRVYGGQAHVLKTILINNGGGDGLYGMPNCSIRSVEGIAFVSKSNSTAPYGIALNGRYGSEFHNRPTQIGSVGSMTIERDVAFVGWGVGAFVGMGCTLIAREVAFSSHRSFGVWSLEGSYSLLRRTVISGGVGTGLQVSTGASTKITEARTIGNQGDGIRLENGSTTYGELPFSFGNSIMGVRLNKNAGFHFDRGYIAHNGQTGVYGVGGKGSFRGCIIACNNTSSIILGAASDIDAEAAWMSGSEHTSRPIVWSVDSFINLLDAALTGSAQFGLRVEGVGEAYGSNITLRKNNGTDLYMALGSKSRLPSAYLSSARVVDSSQIFIPDYSGDNELSVVGVLGVNKQGVSGALISDENGLQELALKSPDGTVKFISIDDGGNLVIT